MANNLKSRPIVIDTFSSDFALATRDITIRKIVMKTASASAVFALESPSGAKVIVMTSVTANKTVELNFDGEGYVFPGGLNFDADDTNANLAGGDMIWIYQK